MNRPLALFAGTVALLATPTRAQQIPADVLARAPELLRQRLAADTRAIRRDVPLTKSIRRAFAAGTRDFTGRPGPNYWQLEADYTITATLDAPQATLTGQERIVVHNTSPDELGELVLRLDHNIFRATAQRGDSMPGEITDGMVLTRIAVDGQNVELTAQPGRRRRGPRTETSVSGLDQTVATIRLAKPIAAHQDAVLEIDWHTRLPGGNGQGHRMTQRWDDTLFQPTQWYPRLAKYDDLAGWHTQPYLGPAEFYNNFGRFDVKLDVPGGWLVSGTGVLQNGDEVLTPIVRERLSHVLDADDEVTVVGEDDRGAGKATAAGERLVWHFVADKVNDFAWATARDYVWHATRATIPQQGPVPIHMVFLPNRANRFRNAGAVARHALEFYSALWIPYAFPQLTMQDGPSSGMEYPMVINSNQGAADHETGHQWWPMTLGTNETTYGWMDEGFNMYMNVLSDADLRGRRGSLDGYGSNYGGISGDESEPPMMWDANYAGDQYGFQTYMKAPMMLSMLGGIVGDDRVQAAMRDYAATWAFKHPSPWDFVFFLSNALEQDLGWFWYYWLWTTESVDGGITEVRTDGADTVVTVHQAGQMPAPIVLKVEFAADGPPPERMANAVFDGDGAAIVTWPVDVWFDGRRTFAARLAFGPRAIAKITLDPHGRFPDGERDDNVWPR